MLELKVKQKLEDFLNANNLDYLDRGSLEEIFDDSELEVNDETGWHGIEAIWVDGDDFYASYSDQDGDEEQDILYLNDDELERLYNWLDLPY